MSAGAFPEWSRHTSERQLLRLFGNNTLARGQEYAREKRVERVTSGSNGGRSVVQAQVRGSRGRAYQVVIRRDDDSGELHVRCSCPIGFECKHGAAVLWYLATLDRRTAAVASWQRALAGITAEATQSSVGRALAIEVAHPAPASVQLRPLLWGKSGRWVRTGISWDSVDRSWGTEYLEAHRLALAALARTRSQAQGWSYYSGRADVLELNSMPASVWPALRAAVDAGVELVPAQGNPSVSLAAAPAELVSRIARVDTGIELRTFAESGEDAWTPRPSNLLGRPAHGFVVTSAHHLLLVPFAEPLSPGQQSLLAEHPRLEIPEADIAAFATEFYPALRRRVGLRQDPEVELPEAQPPHLLLRVAFLPEHVTRLEWGFRYRIGATEHDVGLESTERLNLRDRNAEAALVSALPDGPWPMTERPHRLPVPTAVLTGAATAAFVSSGLDVLADAGVIVVASGERQQYRLATEAPLVQIALTDPVGSTDWFNLAVTISVGEEPVEFAELFTALATGQTHLILPSGTWFSLEAPQWDQLRTLIAEADRLQPSAAEPGLRLRAEHAGLWEELVQLGVVTQQSAAWTSAVGALLSMDALPATPVPENLHATLRPYQEVGFRWLDFLFRTRLGGVLADDMGLGKTLQALGLMTALQGSGELDRPCLVVAPTSVLDTWAREAARFAPGLRVRVVEQTGRRREHGLAELAAAADLVVTSYTLLRLDADEYAGQQWSAVFLDEAQFVKNRHSQVYGAVRKLSARSKFAITGTPLENNLMDLWSLLSITAPGLFPDPESFSELYRRPIESGTDPDALARLHRRIRPLMLRRTKQDVATELPDKQEQVVRVPLGGTHRRIYDKHLAAERKKVLGLVGDLQHNRIKILAALTMLRQLALSPALVLPDQKPDSAKIDALVEMVTELAAEGHRALVFSQFTSYLQLVRDRLDAEGISWSYLDGRTRDRPARIEAFRSGDDAVFLISLKAGGFGLTLTEADYVFILDPWWNPAAETQAIDRTHRIGQDKPVMVYRLVSEDTIEEKVVALQERKRDLFSRVVGEPGDLAAPLTADDIRGLLEF